MVVATENFCVSGTALSSMGMQKKKNWCDPGEDGDVLRLGPDCTWVGTHDGALSWQGEGPHLLCGAPCGGGEHAECVSEVVLWTVPETQGQGLAHLCMGSSPFPEEMVPMLYSAALV